MSQTLYRKYRPQTFTSVLGQQSVVKTITNSLQHNRVGQAYLFTGPRGTGKTTMARLLARAVTCINRSGAEPCLTCAHCVAVANNNSLDIIEIDAASNTGVDNIRDLRDSIKLLPTLSTMKVYIIDEVHMLSIGAFNALLKTLEEPPAHVMFILATTSLHKVPDTIVSRCQKFDFTRLPVENIVQKLTAIAADEKVSIAPSAVHMIALAAEGGMRDAESLLMQIIHSGDANITDDDVSLSLGISSQRSIVQLLDSMIDLDTIAALTSINTVVRNGVDPYIYTNSLIATLRAILLLQVDATLINSLDIALSPEHAAELTHIAQRLNQDKTLQLLSLFQKAHNEIRASSIPQLPLEIAVATFIRKTSGAVSTLPMEHAQPLEPASTGAIIQTQSPQTTPVPAPAKQEMSSQSSKKSREKSENSDDDTPSSGTGGNSTPQKPLPKSTIRKIAKATANNTTSNIATSVKAVSNNALLDETASVKAASNEATSNAAMTSASDTHESTDDTDDTTGIVSSELPPSSENTSAVTFTFNEVQQQWNSIIATVQAINSPLALSLGNCKPHAVTEGGVIELATKFKMYADKVNSLENALTVQGAFDTILKTKTKVRAIVISEPTPSLNESLNPLVNDALSILGGEVVAG